MFLFCLPKTSFYYQSVFELEETFRTHQIRNETRQSDMFASCIIPLPINIWNQDIRLSFEKQF